MFNLISYAERSSIRGQSRWEKFMNILGRKRTPSVLAYSFAALSLGIICTVAFSSMGHDTDFAIAVMGSLIGGFLGALLAVTLVIDSPSQGHDRDFG